MTSRSSKGRVAVFARTPEKGKVKTRLQPYLGEDGCYRLHQDLTRRAINAAVESDIGGVDIWHTGNADHPFWREQTGVPQESSRPIGLFEQQGNDLGARMHFSFSQTLRESEWLILIGSDCPAIDSNYLREAATLLNQGQEAVLGPALDGGYVMIGLSCEAPFLFEGIPWGEPSVLNATLLVAEQNSLGIHRLEPLRDIDTEADFQHYCDKTQLFAADYRD